MPEKEIAAAIREWFAWWFKFRREDYVMFALTVLVLLGVWGLFFVWGWLVA